LNTLATGRHKLILHRWPVVKDDPLQAWDAADVYLLEHMEEVLVDTPLHSKRVLILNDNHGALATALNSLSPQSWSDSYLSQQSALANVASNDCANPLSFLPSTETPEGPIDWLLIRVPKTTALLVDQLARIRPLLHKESKVVAAGMVKHLQKSAFGCLENYIGPVTTSLAKKKARLIFAEYDASLRPPDSPYPSVYTDSTLQGPMTNHANVFSKDQLDHGARFLIEQYQFLRSLQNVVDLACGNGVLGLEYLKRFPQASVSFIDESFSAVDSARKSYGVWFPDVKSTADFLVADGLQNTESESQDLVLCNPPFHQQHVVGDQVALSLFVAAKRCLRQKGELWIVANQHLGYSGKLKRLFGNCRIVASNKKFAVFKVVKR